MSSVRIISIPPGQAPEWVRKKWVGLVIPLPEQETSGLQMGVRGGKAENQGGYQVETREAIRRLEDKSPEASRWWRENLIPEATPRLVFSRAVCELIP